MLGKIDSIKNYVKMLLDSEPTGHDYMHALRVLKTAEELATDELDLDLIRVAALTHDLIDKKVSNDVESSKEELIKLLTETYDLKFAKKIINIIENMSFSSGKVPDSDEGKIVQDADRIDALGAIGIARTFAYGGKNNRSIYHPEKEDCSVNHFYDKLFKLAKLMNTDQGEELARERIAFMHEFIFRLMDEVN